MLEVRIMDQFSQQVLLHEDPLLSIFLVNGYASVLGRIYDLSAFWALESRLSATSLWD